MRSSSVKTFVSVVTLTCTLAIAAPSAEARPSQSRPSQTQAGMTDRVQRVIRQVVKRFFGIAANGLPSDPIPGFTGGTTTASGLPSDPIPVTTP